MLRFAQGFLGSESVCYYVCMLRPVGICALFVLMYLS